MELSPCGRVDLETILVSVETSVPERAMLHTDCGELVQQAIASRQSEIEHLKQTIVAMREGLESGRANSREAVQSAIVDSQDEIRQLRETISALRTQMEQMGFELNKMF